MRYPSGATALLLSLPFILIQASLVLANDLTIDHVRLGQRDPSAKTIQVLFNVSWENSWRNKINHDAAWVTVRLSNSPAQGSALCRMAGSGASPAGTSAGNNDGAELYVPVDKNGVFVRRNVNAPASAFATQDVSLVVDYASCGFSETTQASATVFGLEMVLVPGGAFYAGDQAVSTAALRQGAADNDPWEISSESPVSVGPWAADGAYYVSGGNAGEAATGASFTIPAAFPKGTAAFYAMKYEISEGEWTAFVNSLSAGVRLRRDITDSAHKNTDTVLRRNTVACSGDPLVCTTRRPARAAGFLSWPDLCAFLDWAALRPMTELEFEKAARGPVVPLSGEYAWGYAPAVAAETLSSGAEEGMETVTTPGANAVFADQAYSGGDSAEGEEYRHGPLRGGIFAGTTSSRIVSGGSYYGLMDLSGNVAEWTVSLGQPTGLLFSGIHGDGALSTAAGYEANADAAFWPGLDQDVSRGVVGSTGAGLRGGSWTDSATSLRVSDRSAAACGASCVASVSGGRGVRTLDTQ